MKNKEVIKSDLTFIEACNLLKKSKRTVGRYIKKGLLNPEKVKKETEEERKARCRKSEKRIKELKENLNNKQRDIIRELKEKKTLRGFKSGFYKIKRRNFIFTCNYIN